MGDVIEFYSSGGLLVVVSSSMVPTVGSFISIRGKTWKVTNVTFAVDYADSRSERRMRCNVDVMEPETT